MTTMTMTMRTIILFAALLLALGPGCGSDAGNQITITVKRNKCAVDPGCNQQMLKLIAYKVPFPLPCLLATKDVEVGSGAGTLEGLDLIPGDSIHIGAALYCSNKTYCLSCGLTKKITVTEGSHTLELSPGSAACSLDDSNFSYLLLNTSAMCK